MHSLTHSCFLFLQKLGKVGKSDLTYFIVLKLRPLLSENNPEYCGVTFIDANIENVDNWYPKLGELVGDGINSMLSPGRALIAQRSSNGKVRSYVVVRVEEGWAKKEFAEAQIHGGSERARELLLSFFDGWSRELVDFIRRYDDEPMWPKHSR